MHPALTDGFLFFLSGSPNTSSTNVPPAPPLFFVPTPPAPPLRTPAEDAPSPSPGTLAETRLDAMMRRGVRADRRAVPRRDLPSGGHPSSRIGKMMRCGTQWAGVAPCDYGEREDCKG
ncbi:hypothetical protein EHS25_006009 [Saitozyma podzolica]|uniref:Uncharacterized protein n=1 Tax=Saitozyma podzolica TaxID=1890683 RepID=A0A427XTZ7_9TREE|nr:hypothetical protein EHS25_006009 [Saitozyma podzolica]